MDSSKRYVAGLSTGPAFVVEADLCSYSHCARRVVTHGRATFTCKSYEVINLDNLGIAHGLLIDGRMGIKPGTGIRIRNITIDGVCVG